MVGRYLNHYTKRYCWIWRSNYHPYKRTTSAKYVWKIIFAAMIFVTFTCPFWKKKMVFSPEGIFFWVIKRWENGVRCKQTSLMLINVCKAIFIRRSTARPKTTKKSHVNWMRAACLYHLLRLHDHLSRLHRSWNNSTKHTNEKYMCL